MFEGESAPIHPQVEPTQHPQDFVFDQLLIHYPEAFTRQTADETRESFKENEIRENVITQQDITELLRAYGLQNSDIEILPTGNIRLPVTSHFDTTARIPKGYAYKGGAARALLLRAVGKDKTHIPRDIDLVRIDDNEPYPGADHVLAQRFMTDDYQFGAGVEKVTDIDDYLQSRDFTLNELYATDTEIIATPACLRDTARGIIRITDYERSLFDGPGPKMLSKMLRLYSEGIEENMPVILADISEEELEQSFINPFWLAVQLDRAFQRGSSLAEKFVQTLQKYRQLPPHINTAQEASGYLLDLLVEDNFYFRHAPQSQFDTEDELVAHYYEKHAGLINQYETLPTFRGHGKSRGDK